MRDNLNVWRLRIRETRTTGWSGLLATRPCLPGSIPSLAKHDYLPFFARFPWLCYLLGNGNFFILHGFWKPKFDTRNFFIFGLIFMLYLNYI